MNYPEKHDNRVEGCLAKQTCSGPGHERFLADAEVSVK